MATASLPSRPPEKGGKFRILIGSHLGDGPKGCACDPCLATPEEERKANGGRGKNHVYHQRMPNSPAGYDNDVIESPVADLERRFNQGPGSRKFERIYDERRQEETDELERLRRKVAEQDREIEALRKPAANQPQGAAKK